MGSVKSGTEAYPGWVPGPNPFGNQRASDCETWYRIEGVCQYEIRFDYIHEGWVVSVASREPYTKGSFARPTYGVFRWVPGARFADPMAAMLWFELNKEDL